MQTKLNLSSLDLGDDSFFLKIFLGCRTSPSKGRAMAVSSFSFDWWAPPGPLGRLGRSLLRPVHAWRHVPRYSFDFCVFGILWSSGVSIKTIQARFLSKSFNRTPNLSTKVIPGLFLGCSSDRTLNNACCSSCNAASKKPDYL